MRGVWASLIEAESLELRFDSQTVRSVLEPVNKRPIRQVLIGRHSG
jgi:hypothetical protein